MNNENVLSKNIFNKVRSNFMTFLDRFLEESKVTLHEAHNEAMYKTACKTGLYF